MSSVIGNLILGMLKTVVGKIIEYYIMKKKIADESKKQALEEMLESQKAVGATEEEIKRAQDDVAKKAAEVQDIEEILAALRKFTRKE